MLLCAHASSVKIQKASSQGNIIKHGTSQGSISVPVLYTMFITPQRDVVNSYGISGHYYEDDSKAYTSYHVGILNQTIHRLELC